MGAARKLSELFLKKDYSQKQKQDVEAYLKKINSILRENPEKQKKAAQILTDMIHSK